MFLYSKRFWIPFTISLLISTAVLVFQFWWLYKDDLHKDGIATIIVGKWILSNALIFLGVTLPVSICTGVVWYARDIVRREHQSFLFDKRFWFGAIACGLFTFLHVAFIVPESTHKSRQLLVDIVYKAPGDQFVQTSDLPKSIRSSNFFKLGEFKDSLRSQKDLEWKQVMENIKRNIRSEDVDEVVRDINAANIKITSDDIKNVDVDFSTNTSWQCCHKEPAIDHLIQLNKRYESKEKEIRFLKNNMIALPLETILFCFTGLLITIALSHLPNAISILILWLAILPLWYYSRDLLEYLYKQDSVSVFISAYGTSLLILSLNTLLYYFLKNVGMIRFKSEMELFEEEQMHLQNSSSIG
jgi:hypothetical protein